MRLTRSDLERLRIEAEWRALYLVWFVRYAVERRPDSYVVIPRPRSAALIAKTDEYGVPSYTIECDDVSRIVTERRALYDRSGAGDARLSEELTTALRAARELTRCPSCKTPTHASESDEAGRCEACAQKAGEPHAEVS